MLRPQEILVAASLVLTSVLSTEAHAYLDPGTGSYLLQILAAAVLAGLFALKLFFARIKELFRGIFSKFNLKNGPPV